MQSQLKFDKDVNIMVYYNYLRVFQNLKSTGS